MWLKHRDWILLNIPAFIILIIAFNFPKIRKLMLSTEGYIALALLVVVLALNPLIALFPTQVGLKKLNRHRRIIGVAVFTYAACHAFLYIEKKGLSFFTKWIVHPVILPAFIALVIFLLLAVTSNNKFVKKMGFLRWKKLHTKVYLAEAFIFVHMFLQGGNTRLVAIIAFPLLWTVQYLRRRKRLKLRATFPKTRKEGEP